MGRYQFVCCTNIAALFLFTSCTFNFELTSQRTALENQVLGSYKEIEDELILVSAVRGNSLPIKKESPAASARKNQDFNRDDIEELKSQAILGETHDGELKATSKVNSASQAVRQLTQELIREENRDRNVIWNQIIASNKNLKVSDLPEIRRTYAKLIYERSPSGHLFLKDAHSWVPK